MGNEVTDEKLAEAFKSYTSLQKAKVVRDKRTHKTKGYGFISFKDTTDFTRAMREMNGECLLDFCNLLQDRHCSLAQKMRNLRELPPFFSRTLRQR